MSSEVEIIKAMYPVGSRIRLTETIEDPYHPIPVGSTGTVSFVDDLGHLIMDWDRGGSLSIIPSIDSFELI